MRGAINQHSSLRKRTSERITDRVAIVSPLCTLLTTLTNSLPVYLVSKRVPNPSLVKRFDDDASCVREEPSNETDLLEVLTLMHLPPHLAFFQFDLSKVKPFTRYTIMIKRTARATSLSPLSVQFIQ